MSTYSDNLFKLHNKHQNKNVFVFGANKAGRHGAGAAAFAHEFCGAIYGCGTGFQGNSYAIPTKDEALNILSLQEIAFHVKNFVTFAQSRPDLVFYITAIGTGFAGYQHVAIAPLFAGCPDNCIFPEEWKMYKSVLDKKQEL